MPEDLRHQLIIFHVGPERFVIDIKPMIQIILYREPTPVPRAPFFIEGIIVLRNQVVPVINLCSRLFPDHETGEGRPKILILRVRNQVVGFKVDSVHRIVAVDQEDVLPPPPQFAGLDASFLKGVVHHNEEVYLYLNINTILSPEEIAQLQKTAAIKKPGRKGKHA